MKFKKFVAATAAIALGLTACSDDTSDDAASDTTATTAAEGAAASDEVSLEGVTLKISLQDPAWPAIIDASGVLEGIEYEVEWVLLTGPAANLQALYAEEIDLGHMGDTSLTIEQANDEEEWTEDTAPLQIVAGWRNGYDPEYAPLITAVRTDAGIEELEDLPGSTWAFNFGGYNHGQYLATLALAELTEGDITPAQLADQATSAAAFSAGETDVYSGGQGPVHEAIASGEAEILVTAEDTGIPALNVWTARTETLEDPQKDAALEDFFSRVSGVWEWYVDNEEEVRELLEQELGISGTRLDFEYGLRNSQWRAFDDELLAQEQAVAELLFEGGGIPKQVDATVGFDDRYNEAQGALTEAEVRDAG